MVSTVRLPGKIKKRTKIYMAHPLRAIPTLTYFPLRGFPEHNAVCLFSHLQEISLPVTYSGFQTCIPLNFFCIHITQSFVGCRLSRLLFGEAVLCWGTGYASI